MPLPSFIFGDENLELLQDSHTDEERFHIHARNLLRHIIRGTPLCLKEGDSYADSPLKNPDIINSLLVKRKAELMKALRLEMQVMLGNVYVWLTNPNIQDKTAREQAEVFLKYILTLYPLLILRTMNRFKYQQK